MNGIFRLLFPLGSESARESWLLLAARVIFGGMFIWHGLTKLASFDTLWTTFPDPIGLGSGASLVLDIFAEVLCSAGFIVGALYRLALIPMIFTMCVAILAAHAGDPFAVREPAVIYLTIFVLMYIAGAGRFSIDHMIARAYEKEKPI